MNNKKQPSCWLRCLPSRPLPSRPLMQHAWLMVPALLAGCAATPKEGPRSTIDPLEPINRPIYRFNEKVDKYVYKPVAQGYDWVMPDRAERSVSHFFNNLNAPVIVVNDLLQAKFKSAAKDTGRFAVNTTVGVLGLFDMATDWGMPQGREDFGQTLGTWGVPPGFYIVLPFLGPSTLRDGVGSIADWPADPLMRWPPKVQPEGVRYGLLGLKYVNTRSAYLGAEGVLETVYDPYSYVRDGYLQRRERLIKDEPGVDANRPGAYPEPSGDSGQETAPPPPDAEMPPPPYEGESDSGQAAPPAAASALEAPPN